MKIFWLAFVVAICSLSVTAQDFDHYKTILPQGPIPKDFTEVSSAKVASEVRTLGKEDKARIQRSKKTFVMESTYGVDNFLASGNVLFNDEVSVYLQRVLDEVNKDSQNKIRIYAVKSSSVNAFTVNNGIIFVNLALLARLENEAQLAFILAHEIVHYQKHHAINAYVTNVEMDRGKGNYRNLSVSERGFAKSTFSKEQEFEADLMGSDLYLKSTYAKDSIQKVFDILAYGDLPLIWKSFDKSLFESDGFVFPDSLTLHEQSDSDFSIEEDYDDSHSTHPNIKKRKEAISKKFGVQTGGTHFKVSERSFFAIKKIAQFELCRILLLERRFIEAFALAVNLQSEMPESTYLRETTAKALYGIAMHKLYKESFTASQPLPHAASSFVSFFENQSAYETSVMAIRHLYACKESNPSNVEISLMLYDLLQNFGKENPNVDKKFLRKPDQSKIENLPYPYTQYAFLEFKDVPAFFKLFDKQITQAKKPTSKKTKKKKSLLLTDKPVKANKVVIVNPMYKIIDIRKRNQKKPQHVEAEQVMININEKINDAAVKLDMKVDIINPNKLTSTQVSAMQSNTILNDWIDERISFSEKPLVSPIYNEVIELAEKHKTDHFIWMGGGTIKTKVQGKGFGIFGALLLPAVSPIIAVNWCIPRGNTLYYALSFNVRTQQLELLNLEQKSVRDSKWLLQSNIYNTLFTLKQ